MFESDGLFAVISGDLVEADLDQSCGSIAMTEGKVSIGFTAFSKTDEIANFLSRSMKF
jgi:hypothetical protein